MYAPKQFQEDRREILLSAIGSIRFAALVVWTGDELRAVHLPLIVQERGGELALEGHIARANGLWRLLGAGAPALAMFQGPQAYVHPGWLATKRETGRVVPTWNYIAVHVHGRLACVDDPSWLLRHVDDLTAMAEAGRPEPWSIADAPEGYIDGLARGIVGLRLAVERMQGVWKLIQHHPEANRLGVIAGLAQSADWNDQAMAAAMRAAEERRSAD